jgi:two-component system LytT family response regulator
MLRVMIVDDERLARVALRGLLEERGDVEIVGEADGVASARKQLEALKPDVLFLDVQMPGGSGFELFAGGGLKPKVIFCTAYERHAVRAFEVNALDYLIKPVGPEQIERALNRLLLSGGEHPAEATTLLRLDDLVSLREASTLRFVQVRDLVWIQAADDYSEVHLTKGATALVDVTLRKWEERLPARDFVRIHRSSLVNLHQVAEVHFDEGQGQLALRDGSPPLVVSRRMGRALKARLRERPAQP